MHLTAIVHFLFVQTYLANKAVSDCDSDLEQYGYLLSDVCHQGECDVMQRRGTHLWGESTDQEVSLGQEVNVQDDSSQGVFCVAVV